ncbi:uncharacterized protein [Gossypium hirsutum]|uniref:Uncharacterized protein isoform X2 n=3 Tax=Gossypium TaxID=3633 RepID=A0A1U8LP60_GOSHI|nr:uncharacterized protein LOC107928518 isoform X2 [Gossypium hirsutum]TYI12199.1 hypothetical protein ES332_A09G260800v1 [Gossypium tomentosum]
MVMLCLCRPFGYLLCFLWFLSNGKTVAVLGLMAVGFEFFTACWVFLCWTFANYNDQCCFYSNKLASEKDLNSKRADLKEKSQQALWIALRLIVFLAMAPLVGTDGQSLLWAWDLLSAYSFLFGVSAGKGWMHSLQVFLVLIRLCSYYLQGSYVYDIWVLFVRCIVARKACNESRTVWRWNGGTLTHGLC